MRHHIVDNNYNISNVHQGMPIQVTIWQTGANFNLQVVTLLLRTSEHITTAGSDQ